MPQPVQLATQAIPQADVLWDVVRVPIAVRAGACDVKALAAALGARVERQAVYYTQAARILGLVAERPAGAPLQLTPYGHAFVRYDVQGQHRALRHLMLHIEPMRSKYTRREPGKHRQVYFSHGASARLSLRRCWRICQLPVGKRLTHPRYTARSYHND